MVDSWRPLGSGIDLVADDTFSEAFTVVTLNEFGDLVVQDVSGGTYSAVIKATPTGTALATLTVDSTGAATGVLRVTASSTQTSALNVTDQVLQRIWALKWTRADSTEQTLLTGRVIVSPKVA